jgi:hypothetical protein
VDRAPLRAATAEPQHLSCYKGYSQKVTSAQVAALQPSKYPLGADLHPNSLRQRAVAAAAAALGLNPVAVTNDRVDKTAEQMPGKYKTD